MLETGFTEMHMTVDKAGKSDDVTHDAYPNMNIYPRDMNS